MTSSSDAGRVRKEVLRALTKGPLPRKRLMERVRGNRGLVSKTVNELRDEGLIEPTDRGFALTPEGLKALVEPERRFEYRDERIELSREGENLEEFLRVIKGESKSRTGSIVVTTRCDMRCKFCYYNLVKEHVDLEPEETLEEAERRVRAGNREIVLQGASPHLLDGDLVEAVSMIKEELSVDVAVGTGPTIPVDLLEDLKLAGLDYVKFSLSGRTPEEWKAVTGRRKGFEELWEAVAWCLANDLEVSFVGGVVGLPGIPPEADAERVAAIKDLNPGKSVIQFNPAQDPVKGPFSGPGVLRTVYEGVRRRVKGEVFLKSCCVTPASMTVFEALGGLVDKVVCMLGRECREYHGCPFTGRVLEQKILNVLHSSGSPLSVRELARRTGIGRAKLSKRLRSLERRGVVERTEEGWRLR